MFNHIHGFVERMLKENNGKITVSDLIDIKDFYNLMKVIINLDKIQLDYKDDPKNLCQQINKIIIEDAKKAFESGSGLPVSVVSKEIKL